MPAAVDHSGPFGEFKDLVTFDFECIGVGCRQNLSGCTSGERVQETNDRGASMCHHETAQAPKIPASQTSGGRPALSTPLRTK
jgi:hypothetical protein